MYVQYFKEGKENERKEKRQKKKRQKEKEKALIGGSQ